MKIKLEPQKTFLRLTKEEFMQLIGENRLSENTSFPNGADISIHLTLSAHAQLHFENNVFEVTLPKAEISDYKPRKSGLSFNFHTDNRPDHELIFEVDIKKPPLGTQKKSKSD